MKQTKDDETTSLLMGTLAMLMKNPHLEPMLTQESETRDQPSSSGTTLLGQTIVLLLFLIAIILRYLTT
jgi:hypothetical protein